MTVATGLYLTGGLTPKNIALLRDPQGPFMAALLDKVRSIVFCEGNFVHCMCYSGSSERHVILATDLRGAGRKFG